MDFSGIILFDVENESFRFLENSSAKVSKILEMVWNADLRHQTAKITIEGQPRKVKLFCRVCRTSNSKGIQTLVNELNARLKEESNQDEDIFAADSSYSNLVKRIPIDLVVDEELREEITHKNCVSQEELNRVIDSIREEFAEDMKKSHEKLKLELLKEFRKMQKESQIKQTVKVEPGDKFLEDLQDNKIKLGKILPFDNDEDIDAFFGIEGNSDLLYEFVKKYFANPKTIVKGMHRLLSVNYMREHIWSTKSYGRWETKGHEQKTHCNENLVNWLKATIIHPVEAEDPFGEKKKIYMTRITRVFSDSRKNFRTNFKKKFEPNPLTFKKSIFNDSYDNISSPLQENNSDDDNLNLHEEDLQLSAYEENDDFDHINNLQPMKKEETKSEPDSIKKVFSQDDKIRVAKVLPFNTDQEIDTFFGVKGNADMLYEYIKNYFNHLQTVCKGTKRLLTRNYLRSHIWDRDYTKQNIPKCNRKLKGFIEKYIIHPIEAEDPTCKLSKKYLATISRIFMEERKKEERKSKMNIDHKIPTMETYTLDLKPLNTEETNTELNIFGD